MRPHKTLGAVANCGMRCAEQDHVAGGEKRYPHSSTPKATPSSPPFINNPAANRGALGESALPLGAAVAGRPTYRWCEFLELRELKVVDLVKSVI
jgi:hypothetical protein